MEATKKYHLANLDCADCAAKIESGLKALPGVRFASVSFATETLHLDADDFGAVRNYINQIEPDVYVRPLDTDPTEPQPWFTPQLALLGASLLLFLVGLLLRGWLQSTPFGIGEYLVFGVAYLLSGGSVISAAVRNLRNRAWFDESFLMSIATLGAFAIGELPEAVGVMLFYKFGEYVQDLSVNRSRRSIQALLETRPDFANLVTENGTRQVSPEKVHVGDTILVRPGERVPLDGEVLSGRSLVDTSALTGESRPRNLEVGDQILAGMVNKTAMLTVKITKGFEESSASRLLELVQNAAGRKARTEKFITRFANYYTPAVVVAALGVAVLPPLLIPGAVFTEWVYRALVLLVISCPCALMISIPLGYFGGVGSASRRGILVKGANYLDVLANVKTVVFDKTGTLTRGVFKVTEVVPKNGFDEKALLRIAAQGETHSSHPIAQSIREAVHEHGLDVPGAEEFTEIAGYGVQTKVNGNQVIVGSHEFMHRLGVDHDECDVAGTAVHVAVDGKYAGYIVVTDELKSDAPQSIRALKEAGVKNIVMLTGDEKQVGEDIARQVGIEDYRGELLPEDKLGELDTLLAGRPAGKVAFVGDGINDAPVIARADVGIAMGAMGSDAAIETADVVLMTDAPSKVAEAIQIGKRTRSIVWQNIALALGVKAAFVFLGVLGVATMWEAVFADVGVTVLAVFNAARILK